MATVPDTPTVSDLHSGDHLTREEFHRIYEQAPEDFRAELIGGIVYLASPLKRSHGTNHSLLNALLVLYAGRTSGVEVADNSTILLAHDCEPQPDLLLRILPEFGGQSETTDDDYIKGPPEFIAEIAHSSHAIDLHAKYDDYARHGVCEYIVVCLRDNIVRWFNLESDTERKADDQAIIRIQTFPGLWINAPALLAGDQATLMQTLEQGLATQEHKEFVQHLQNKHNA